MCENNFYENPSGTSVLIICYMFYMMNPSSCYVHISNKHICVYIAQFSVHNAHSLIERNVTKLSYISFGSWQSQTVRVYDFSRISFSTGI